MRERSAGWEIVGFIAEMEPYAPGARSLRDLVQRVAVDGEEVLVWYLNSGTTILASAGMASPDPLSDDGQPVLVTDVVADDAFIWPGYLGYLVARYHMRVPSTLSARAANAGGTCVELS